MFRFSSVLVSALDAFIWLKNIAMMYRSSPSSPRRASRRICHQPIRIIKVIIATVDIFIVRSESTPHFPIMAMAGLSNRLRCKSTPEAYKATAAEQPSGDKQHHYQWTSTNTSSPALSFATSISIIQAGMHAMLHEEC